MTTPTGEPWIRLYVRAGATPPRLVPSPAARRWYSHNASRCLPLVVAGQLGWTLLSPVAFTAVWDGRRDPKGVRLNKRRPRDSRGLYIDSRFGDAIVTIGTGLFVRTSPDVDLLVKAVPNVPKDGVGLLEGLIETDWFEGSLTVNLRLTRPGLTVRWEAGEPLCQLVPYPRGWIERFRPELVDDGDDHATFFVAAERWKDDRIELLDMLRAGHQPPYDGRYRRGIRHDGVAAPPSHRPKLSVRPFPKVEPAPRDF